MWLVADTHFSHPKIITYCNRPFKDVAEMDEQLIARWNAVVSKGDRVYHLGDFSFRQSIESINKLVKTLNGNIHLIYGNHDDERKLKRLNCFAWQGHLRYIRTRLKDGSTQKIMMCHYAMRTWRAGFKGSWMLHGHSHGTLKDAGGKTLDVGVDKHGYVPVHVEGVRAYMVDRPICVADYHQDLIGKDLTK